MNRILTYQIEEAESGLRIEQFLRRRQYSRQNLVELKRMHESILLNGRWAYLSERLQHGDTLIIHIQEDTSSEHIPAVKLPLQIVYEDEDLIVVMKPAGMPIHPSINHYHNSLANALAYYYKEQGKPFIFRCSNRLDCDTSGLTVIAKHLISASILCNQTANGGVTREYQAIVRGILSEKSGTITAPIARKEGSIIERCVDEITGDAAITHYRLLREVDDLSLVSLKLETGRTHQIRVHMKSIGHPLIGDCLYNPTDNHLIRRQALHCYRIAFTHPITGETLCFTSDLPADMQSVLG
jgi:23S rRNA pseudouridine1911/1915/1917 synthase